MTTTYDKLMFNMTVSINKALNPLEAPLKIKHARSIIITTHRVKEAKSFWMAITRQPLMENRFTAWKFCHLLHKVLREGHDSTIKHSRTHKKLILEMGKLWGHLQDGVGSCIQAYSQLIVTKLDFHEKNVLFPGSLQIDFKEIEKAAADDINIYFQLCVEIFDYLDDIIELQSRVFVSINTYRMSSMTPQGQCRLAPLITLIQDSNPLYDLCVRVMFKLHDKLPNDILTGHRDRFREQFFKVKAFYDNVRPLQYFFDLIQVPHLPDAAPNFTSRVDFGSYVPPVMYVQPDPEPQMENLIDTAVQEPLSNANDNAVLQNTIKESENTIRDLQCELSAVKQNCEMMERSYETEINRLRGEIGILQTELGYAKEMFQNMESQKTHLEQKLLEAPIIMQKAAEEEQKAKVSEEKFTKLKTMYAQIRDEHINLLRQQGETTRNLNKQKQANAELQSQIEQIKTQVGDLEAQVQNNEIVRTEKSEIETKNQELTQQYEKLNEEHEKLKKDFADFSSNKCAEIDQLTTQTVKLQEDSAALNQSKSQVSFLEKSLNATTHNYEKLQAEHQKLKKDYEDFSASKCIQIDELNTERLLLQADSEALQKSRTQIFILEDSLKTVNDKLAQKETDFTNTVAALEEQLKVKHDDLQQMQSTYNAALEEKDAFLRQLEVNFEANDINLKEKSVLVEQLQDENGKIKNMLQELTQNKQDLEEKLTAIISEVQIQAAAKQASDTKYEDKITSLFHNILYTMEMVTTSKIDELNQPNFEKTLKLIDEMKLLLKATGRAYQEFTDDRDSIDELLRKAILLGCLFTTLHEQCLLIYNTTTDIGKGEDIFNQINSIKDPLIQLYKSVKNAEQLEQTNQAICNVKSKLAELHKSVSALVQATTTNIDLADLVENELAEMDKAIEDAAEKFVELLSNSRSKDDGIKLEVNEKILDACTALMVCIKLLIQRAKTLQGEIVSTGRGTTSVKEFYKRNSQWTEGLISASKSVAKGANLLVDAANKAVTTESSQNFEIIVAAQEIAACTAQLVIASKVKAPKESRKLGELTKASRDVSQATGKVVATVKDCSQHLEQLQEVDVSKLTSSQAKTMEMEIHVKVLELEQALQTQRFKLAAFRKNHYQNSDV